MYRSNSKFWSEWRVRFQLTGLQQDPYDSSISAFEQFRLVWTFCCLSNAQVNHHNISREMIRVLGHSGAFVVIHQLKPKTCDYQLFNVSLIRAIVYIMLYLSVFSERWVVVIIRLNPEHSLSITFTVPVCVVRADLLPSNVLSNLITQHNFSNQYSYILSFLCTLHFVLNDFSLDSIINKKWGVTFAIDTDGDNYNFHLHTPTPDLEVHSCYVNW